MNHQHHTRFTFVGRTLLPVIALFVMLAPRISAQQSKPDSVIRLTLGSAVRLAAHDNAAVEAARARVDVARAKVTQRRADLLPAVSAALAERGSTINSATFPIEFPTVPGQPPLFDRNGSVLGPVNAFDARARISQTLFDPAARSRVEHARGGIDVANAEAANISDLVAGATANAYVAVLRADAVYTARLADATLAAELLRIAQDQLRAGTGIALDVTRARSQLTGARAQLIMARNERQGTRIQLAGLLGMSPERIEITDNLASLPSTQVPAGAASIDVAQHNRKDVQALTLQAAVARQEAVAIRNERLPTVGVFADEGLSQRNGRSYLPTHDWGIQVSVPIFDGFDRAGRVEEQVSSARDLDIRARDLRFRVQSDVRIATLNLGSSAEAMEAARERLSLAEQEVAQARERFQAGVSSNADVVTAALTLNAARTQLVDALSSYQSSRVALARALGTITTLE